MIQTKLYLLILSLAVAAATLMACLASDAQAQADTELKPGTYRCRPSGAALFRGRCEYRPLANGITQQLREKAQRAVKPLAKQKTANNLEPQVGMYGDIEWWFEDDNGLADDKANKDMGEFLQANDRSPTIQIVPQVAISATMYRFTEKKVRELGLEVSTFLGERSLDARPPKAQQTLSNGLFKTAIGIGNPLASFLELGITATANNESGREKKTWAGSCPVGISCSAISDIAKHKFPAPTNVMEESVGLTLTATPWIDPTQPGLVMLQGLTVIFSELTGIEKAPVRTHTMKMNSDTPVYTDQILILGSEINEATVSGSKLLSTGSGKESEKFLIVLKVSVVMPRGVPNPHPNYEVLPHDRALTPQELAALPDGKLALADVFKSVELYCINDMINPENNDPVCGFRFTELDRRYIDYRLRFTIKKDGILGWGSNTLANENQRTSVRKFSDVFRGKGFYTLPSLVTEDAANHYTVVIELDDSNPIAKTRRSKESVIGIKIPIGYYKGAAQPIEFDRNAIQYIGPSRKGS